jgi:hypothetical protein
MALALLATAACAGVPRRALGGLPAGYAGAVADPASVAVEWLRVEALPLPAGGGAVVVDAGSAPSAGTLPPAAAAALRSFLAGGGRLVLFGHAARLACALGLEPAVPETTTLRWGYDARAVAGRADLGFETASAALADVLGADLAAAAPGLLWLAGAAPCTAPVCAWAVGPPQAGAVLGRLVIARDGVAAPGTAPVVVHWRAGAGEVLACGVLPRLDHPDATVAAAARDFVTRCAAWARRAGGLAVLVDGVATAEAAAPAGGGAPLPPTAPLLPHWGWEAPRVGARGERNGDEVLLEVLLPSWLAGADSALVGIVGDDGSSPLVWPAGDPLQPAPSYRSRAEGQPWSAAAFQALAREAHARGMLVFGGLEPLPIGERTVERLVALRFLARELACARGLGAGAFDGFVLPPWSRDPAGRSLAMAQDFQPAATLLQAGEVAPEVGGALRALDADDGSVRGLPFAGVTAHWRDGFAASAFPVGLLDARQSRETTPDWLVAQANDFVRARAGQGAAMWWRRHDPAALAPDATAYVEGVSLEPLRAAVAMPLASTGADGLRAAAAALVRDLPEGFAPGGAPPAAVHVLQNNWFQLAGSGGALLYDPLGEARFGGAARAVAPAFLRTRLFGAAPDAASLRTGRLDFLAGGTRAEGGYRGPWRVDVGVRDGQLPPAALAHNGEPQWPAELRLQFQATPGYHELELRLRPLRGEGLVAVAFDGVLLRALPCRGSEPVTTAVPVHIATGGDRVLSLRLLVGGAVAIDGMALRRAGDVSVEATPGARAGSYASLREVAQSTYHVEHVLMETLADLPGFVLRARCERSARALQIERTFALPGYDTLLPGSDANAADLSAPFVLSAAVDARAPDLVVVPLGPARAGALRWRPGELTWRGSADDGAPLRLGVLLCPRGDGSRRVAAATAQLAGLADPLAFDFAGGRTSVSLTSDVTAAWSRLLRLDHAPPTPFLVREDGWWTLRGTQAAGAGARWLRVRQAPDDVVEVVGGPSVLARTRPGPGSLRLVALREPAPDAATVAVLQPSPLCTPSVVMGRDFADVTLDGQGWAFHDGRTVFLPNRAGRYGIVTRDHAAGPGPHVRATRAPLVVCRYVPAERTLVLATAGGAARPAELPWTAVLGGPRPVAIDNGEIVDDASLRFRDAAAAAAAARGGVLVRFGDGVCRIRYAE